MAGLMCFPSFCVSCFGAAVFRVSVFEEEEEEESDFFNYLFFVLQGMFGVLCVCVPSLGFVAALAIIKIHNWVNFLDHP